MPPTSQFPQLSRRKVFLPSPGALFILPSVTRAQRTSAVSESPPPRLDRGMDGKIVHKHKNSLLTGEHDLGIFFQEHAPGGSIPERDCVPEEQSALMSPGGHPCTTARRTSSRKLPAIAFQPVEQCALPSYVHTWLQPAILKASMMWVLPETIFPNQ